MPRGRPGKLTPELREALVAAIRRTYYLEAAADIVGIDRMTVYRWLRRGRKEKAGPYRDFCCALKKALAEKMATNLDGIQAAAADSWQALAWLNERRWPDLWGSSRKEIAELKKRLDALEKGKT